MAGTAGTLHQTRNALWRARNNGARLLVASTCLFLVLMIIVAMNIMSQCIYVYDLMFSVYPLCSGCVMLIRNIIIRSNGSTNSFQPYMLAWFVTFIRLSVYLFVKIISTVNNRTGLNSFDPNNVYFLSK